MKIKAIIVDDDVFVREELKDLLKHTKYEIELISDFEHPLEAIEFIKSSNPDLLFLDIQMPVMNGFEMLDHLDTSKFEVIFITSFNQYAIQAIRYSALDYLLKPIEENELVLSLERFRQRTEKTLTQTRLANLKHNFSAKNENDFQLIIPTKQGEHQFAIGDIIRCEADSNYTSIYLTNGKKFMASKTLSDIETMLPQEKFLRVHKSHLVNSEHISRLTQNDELVMSDNTQIAISRRRLSEVKQALKNLS